MYTYIIVTTHMVRQIKQVDILFDRGLDFRPDYRKVSDIVSLFSDIPTLLLSATATMSVQNDLYNLLALDEENTRVVAKLPDR